MNRKCRSCANFTYGEQRCRALAVEELPEGGWRDGGKCAAWRPRPIKADCPCKPSFYLCPRRNGRATCRRGGCLDYEDYRAELARRRHEQQIESDITSVLIEGKKRGGRQ